MRFTENLLIGASKLFLAHTFNVLLVTRKILVGAKFVCILWKSVHVIVKFSYLWDEKPFYILGWDNERLISSNLIHLKANY